MSPLLTYIDSQLKLGVTREVITSQLLGQGWQKNDIDRAFISLEVPVTPQAVPVTPVAQPAPVSVPVTPAPVAAQSIPITPASTPTSSVQPKKKSSTLLVVLLILLIGFFLVIGIGAYIFFNYISPIKSIQKQPDFISSTTTEVTQPIVQSAPEQVVPPVATPSAPVATDPNLITFDDLKPTTSGSVGSYMDIPNMYKGYTWTGFKVYKLACFSKTCGYRFAMVSPENFAFTDSGIISSSGTFNLVSGYFTSAWRDNLNVLITGYRQGKSVYSKLFTLSATDSTFLDLNIQGVDKIAFQTSGGSSHPGYSLSSSEVAMDDLIITQ